MKKPYNNYAFIDGQNLNLGIQDIGWKLDFQRFRMYLKENYGVSTAYYFIGKMEDNQELYDALKEAGYILIYKEVLTDPFGKTKGNIDAELVLQAMVDFNNYHKAVIVSGDGDFACLVTYLDSKRKLERVIVPNSYRYSSLLKKAAGTRLDSMNELKRKLSYRRSRKKKDELDKPFTAKKTIENKPVAKPKSYKQAQKKPIANKPQTYHQTTQKQIPAKPTEPKLPFHSAVANNESRKRKSYQNPFRVVDKESSLFSKPLFESKPVQKQVPAVPTTPTPTAPKKFFKKFRYPRKKNFNPNKQPFTKQTSGKQQNFNQTASAGVRMTPKSPSDQKQTTVQPIANKQTAQKQRFGKHRFHKHSQQKQTGQGQAVSKPTTFNQPAHNQQSDKPVTGAPQKQKSFFGRFRFGGKGVDKKRMP